MSFDVGAGAYGRLVGRYTTALASAFCDAVGVAAGQTALDVGCGTGALVGELAGRLGPEQVAGVDPSEPFLDLARSAVPGVDAPPGCGRDAALRGRRVRSRDEPAGRELHDRRPPGRVRDAARRAAHGGGLRLGLRRRDDDAAGLLRCRARARPGRARRGPDDAVLLARRAPRTVARTARACPTRCRRASSSSPPTTLTSTTSGRRSRTALALPGSTPRSLDEESQRAGAPRGALLSPARLAGGAVQPQRPGLVRRAASGRLAQLTRVGRDPRRCPMTTASARYTRRDGSPRRRAAGQPRRARRDRVGHRAA